MFEEGYETPRRKKTADSCLSDLRHKYSTINSCCSRDTKRGREFEHILTLDQRRESRLNSLMKIRKDKLVQITGQNQQIYLKINQQESHYPAARINYALVERGRNKENEEDKLLGPIGNWQQPACFLPANRAIMCEQQSGVGNIKLTFNDKRSPSLEKALNDPKVGRGLQKASKLKELLFYTPGRERRLPDIYIP